VVDLHVQKLNRKHIQRVAQVLRVEEHGRGETLPRPLAEVSGRLAKQDRGQLRQDDSPVNVRPPRDVLPGRRAPVEKDGHEVVSVEFLNIPDEPLEGLFHKSPSSAGKRASETCCSRPEAARIGCRGLRCREAHQAWPGYGTRPVS